ncbi:hypothetical protein NOF04DRAFT_1072126 [Fusarium oxysporum II5]|uniref:Nitrogen regulatory protein areA GATA-like domain-containing protein n=2 Tax=Fusarium oxysporum species complex TaxID=171631 RepID=X0K7X6_FUSO5|nr:uncharacterized protein FOIG_02335 [Fusarium odoratissimum NRRL 54006]XP_031071656.1 uncharacterized protein FOIG_02335 [Fusarium odoratissimum NRRL 54006]XP_031071657.1 uncharacterized protein FOIG_02335 [Fusarium odoratissimum NRRL 54006]KAH7199966.1 hypothetical protein DER44DRAFT_673195 [Fusarium oxysporum]KAK2128381.1 hypothetical protein NOF04DRAFT_1072126 [Fusarium oxysporum II5]TXC05606.1 hypothetical protein FocTR4_00010216 [Fusarium oxysporum f. sp. cubense]EXM09566.1 hypothetica
MDLNMPMILPKGIVINSKNIYKEVADFPLVPPDKVWEYWHVYTTTYKKLKDPTACRLENFWWHVWGSDRRFLKGSALAKLYEEISVGPTFVPLKGPPNRWEGPDIPPLIRQILEAAESQATPPLTQTQGSRPSRSTDSALRTLSSSASKPPPAHPILKKARGPSSSGPRPTARFVSPHESADEDEIPSSGSTAATVSEAPVYVTDPPKKKMAIAPPQKLTPSSPVTSKKTTQLSKSSSSAGPVVREAGAGKSSGPRNGTLQRPVVNIARTSVEYDQPASRDMNGMTREGHPYPMSEKARGKQPAVPVRPVTYRNEVVKDVIEEETWPSPPKDRPRSIHREKGVLPQARSLINLANHGPRRGSGASSRSTIGVGSLESGRSLETPPMARSHSHGGYDQPKPHNNIRAPGLFTEATSSTSNVAVTGTILDQSGFGSTSDLSTIDHSRLEHHTIPVVPPQPSILDARFTPTPPTTTASVPLGRTKSQLTLLLEREKARSGDRSRSRN